MYVCARQYMFYQCTSKTKRVLLQICLYLYDGLLMGNLNTACKLPRTESINYTIDCYTRLTLRSV